MPTRLDYPAWIPSVIAEGKLGSKRRKFVLNAFFGWDETMLPQSTRAEHQVGKVLGPPGLTLGVLGVVYGDIGTSPLYALKLAVKAASTTGLPSPAAVLGAVSLIFWSLILVSLKYVILMLRADNRGEGGILAIIALLGTRQPRPGTWYAALLLVGLVGAGLFYGEATIAPAISILAAVEGLKTEAPQFAPYVVPITILVLIGLFAFQRDRHRFHRSSLWSVHAAVVRHPGFIGDQRHFASA